MGNYIVMCRVSGGVTGTREAPLKSNGAVRGFATEAEAADEAQRLNRQMNGNPYRTADFRYWVEPVAYDERDDDVEACPGCGCGPGDGRTEGCDDPDGCGYWDALEKSNR